MKTYTVKEIFYSPQGEGHRVGLLNIFIRFAGCNLVCRDTTKMTRPLQGNEVSAGFDCDTDYFSGQKLTAIEIAQMVHELDRGPCKKVIFTGGEPGLQLDIELCWQLKALGYYLAIETNGTKENVECLRNTPKGLDWVSCSPKPSTQVAIRRADEVRCVVRAGQAPDPQGIDAQHYFVSPASNAPPPEQIPGWKASPADLNQDNIDWAVEWCSRNPNWRVSLQMHKILGVR